MGGFIVRLLGLIVTGLVLTGSIVFFGASLRGDVSALSHEVVVLRSELVDARGDLKDTRVAQAMMQRDIDSLRAEAKQSDMTLQLSIQTLKTQLEMSNQPGHRKGDK